MSKKLDDLVAKLRATTDKLPLSQFLTKYGREPHYTVITCRPEIVKDMDGLAAAIRYAASLCPDYLKKFCFVVDQYELVGMPVGEEELVERLRMALDKTYKPKKPKAPRLKKGQLSELPPPDTLALSMDMLRFAGSQVTAVLHLSDMFYDSNYAPEDLYGCMTQYMDTKRDRLRARDLQRGDTWRPTSSFQQQELQDTVHMFLHGVPYKEFLGDVAVGGGAVGAFGVEMAEVVNRFQHFMDQVSPSHEEHCYFVFTRSATRCVVLVIEASMSSVNNKAKKIFKAYTKSEAA